MLANKLPIYSRLFATILLSKQSWCWWRWYTCCQFCHTYTVSGLMLLAGCQEVQLIVLTGV